MDFSSTTTQKLKTVLAGQIARALAVFCVDEIIVFDDGQDNTQEVRKGHESFHGYQSGEGTYTGDKDPGYFLTHILSYLETPPHLRTRLFPMHADLKLAGALPSLDMPHHLRTHEWCQYREGITIERVAPGREDHKGPIVEVQRNKSLGNGSTSTLVDAGLSQKVSLAGSIPPNNRVTIKLSCSNSNLEFSDDLPTATAVAPSLPREEAGFYWGYTVRRASSLSAVFTESPFDGGYDLTFGTSERGIALSTLTASALDSPSIPEFNHMLIAFGGVAGLETAVKADAELLAMGVHEPKTLFDYWVNLCPGQGSRTIRTEEAIWLGLMGLRDTVVRKGRK